MGYGFRHWRACGIKLDTPGDPPSGAAGLVFDALGGGCDV
jgi:hypothetical protein